MKGIPHELIFLKGGLCIISMDFIQPFCRLRKVKVNSLKFSECVILKFKGHRPLIFVSHCIAAATVKLVRQQVVVPSSLFMQHFNDLYTVLRLKKGRFHDH